MFSGLVGISPILHLSYKTRLIRSFKKSVFQDINLAQNFLTRGWNFLASGFF